MAEGPSEGPAAEGHLSGAAIEELEEGPEEVNLDIKVHPDTRGPAEEVKEVQHLEDNNKDKDEAANRDKANIEVMGVTDAGGRGSLFVTGHKMRFSAIIAGSGAVITRMSAREGQSMRLMKLTQKRPIQMRLALSWDNMKILNRKTRS